MAWRRHPTGRGRSPRSRMRSRGRGGGSRPYLAGFVTSGGWSSPVGGRITSTIPARRPPAAGRSGWTAPRHAPSTPSKTHSAGRRLFRVVSWFVNDDSVLVVIEDSLTLDALAYAAIELVAMG